MPCSFPITLFTNNNSNRDCSGASLLSLVTQSSKFLHEVKLSCPQISSSFLFSAFREYRQKLCGNNVEPGEIRTPKYSLQTAALSQTVTGFAFEDAFERKRCFHVTQVVCHFTPPHLELKPRAQLDAFRVLCSPKLLQTLEKFRNKNIALDWLQTSGGSGKV